MRPRTAPGDYGFILRRSSLEDDGPIVQFVVSSDGGWKLLTGSGSADELLASGTLSPNASAGERNHLMAVVVEDRGWFFVNDEFIAAGDLGAAMEPGDIAVMSRETRDMRLTKRSPDSRTSR